MDLYSSVQTFNLSRDGQITDRFTQEIEQLGPMEIEAQVGDKARRDLRTSKAGHHRAVGRIDPIDDIGPKSGFVEIKGADSSSNGKHRGDRSAWHALDYPV